MGQILTFKSFFSTSSNLETAQNCTWKTLFKIVRSQTSKNISEFSYYGNAEEEHLFEPYSQFKILEISYGVNDKLVVLQELPKPQIEQETSLILLWVDDQIGECRGIWDSLKEINKTVVLVQLKSTKKLTTWLKNNQKVIADPRIEIVMITRMYRQENGKTVIEAGIKDISVFRNANKNGRICLYDSDSPTNQVPQSLRHIGNLQVACKKQQVRSFLEQLGLK